MIAVMQSQRMLFALSSIFLCSIPNAASGQPTVLTEVRRFVPGDGNPGDAFGWSVAVSDNAVVVGAPGAFHKSVRPGAAYVFNALTGSELFKLTGNDATDSDNFGLSVSIDGSLAIVGVPGDDDLGFGSGSSYLFDVTNGVQLRKLTAADGRPSDEFGGSVDINGKYAIVGAKFDSDPNFGVAHGSAYIYDVVTGDQVVKLTASNLGMFHQFGWSVAVSPDKAVVGAPKNIATGMRGTAYVFDVPSGVQQFELPSAPGCRSCGYSVDTDGNLMIVGAPLDETERGVVRIFDVTTGDELFSLRASDGQPGDRFGVSVAIDGNLAIVGARFEGTGAFGAAYVYDATTGMELFKLVDSNRTVDGEFGFSVAIDENTAIVGARSANVGGMLRGAAYMFMVPEPSTVGLMSSSIALVLLARAMKNPRTPSS